MSKRTQSSDDESVSDTPYSLPNMDFEFVEVENTSDNHDNEDEDAQEFSFRLFNSEDRGRSEVQVVSLREPSPERIVNEKPHSYYFAVYSEEVKKQFDLVAVTGAQVFEQAREPYPETGYVLDVAAHNAMIERSKKSRRRPGKKKRLVMIECRERKMEREKIRRKEEKERINKEKKKYGKFKGTKAKPQRPKYRTE